MRTLGNPNLDILNRMPEDGLLKKVGVCVPECSMMEKNAENPPLNIGVGITFYCIIESDSCWKE